MNNLRQYRKLRKLTQVQLAELIGSTQNSISAIESGKWDPTLKHAYKLSSVLRVPLYILFPDGSEGSLDDFRNFEILP